MSLLYYSPNSSPPYYQGQVYTFTPDLTGISNIDSYYVNIHDYYDNSLTVGGAISIDQSTGVITVDTTNLTPYTYGVKVEVYDSDLTLLATTMDNGMSTLAITISPHLQL